MARLITSGLDIGEFTAEGIGVLSARASFVTTTVRSGSRSLKSDSTGSNLTANTIYTFTGATGRTYFFRAYVYLDQLPSATAGVLLLGNVSARLTSGGKLQLFNDTAGTQIGSDSAATLTTGQWYRVELSTLVGAGAVDTAGLRLDGVSVASATGLALSDAAPSSGNVGWVHAPGAGKVLYHDDVALNDDQGASQNTWPGDGKVVLLVPTADSARATLWVAGAGGTTNLWSAVDNTPPVGVASASATNTSQIEHGGGAAGTTDAYDATMTTYSAAGIASGATVNVVQAVIAHGEDIATGTKVLTFSVVSNPAIASAGNFNAGADAGAVGTYPTTWTITRGTASYAPSVTLGTAPVMRVTRPETASRVASVCFMGMVVDYTPVATIAIATAADSASTTDLAATVAHTAIIAPAAVSTTAFATAVSHPVALAADSASTATFAGGFLLLAAVAPASASTATIAASVAHTAIVAPASASTADLAASVAHTAVIAPASASTATYASAVARPAALAADGASTATVTASVAHPVALAADATTTSALAATVAHAAVLAATSTTTATLAATVEAPAVVPIAVAADAASTAVLAAAVSFSGAIAPSSASTAALAAVEAHAAALAATSASTAALATAVAHPAALAADTASSATIATAVARPAQLAAAGTSTGDFAATIIAPGIVLAAVAASSASTMTAAATVAHTAAMAPLSASTAAFAAGLPVAAHLVAASATTGTFVPFLTLGAVLAPAASSTMALAASLDAAAAFSPATLSATALAAGLTLSGLLGASSASTAAFAPFLLEEFMRPAWEADPAEFARDRHPADRGGFARVGGNGLAVGRAGGGPRLVRVPTNGNAPTATATRAATGRPVLVRDLD